MKDGRSRPLNEMRGHVEKSRDVLKAIDPDVIYICSPNGHEDCVSYSHRQQLAIQKEVHDRRA